MPDMLASLLKIPDHQELIDGLKQEGINIRRAQPFEISILRRYIQKTFGEGWADEAMNAFAHQPVTCFIATYEQRIIGFGAYECTRRNFFGPTGVSPEFRGKGIGKALFLVCMQAMYDMGYAYAIIGGAGPTEFYAKAVGAIEIPDSKPGIYVAGLKRDG